MALFVISLIEAKQDFLIRLIEGVACTTFKIKVQIGLTLQLASNNFTCLKELLMVLLTVKAFNIFSLAFTNAGTIICITLGEAIKCVGIAAILTCRI